MLNSLKICTRAIPSYFFIILSKIELEVVCLSISEMLAFLVDTSTADDKYSLRNRKNSSQPIEMQLSKKQKQFCQYFAAYQKSTSNFDYFEQKDDPHKLCFFEIRDCKR